jgi:nucleotide-binding universal stress UspA family protein
MERILVGIDGSSTASAALQWALAYADDDDVLVLVHGWTIPVMGGRVQYPAAVMGDLEAAAHQLVAAAAAEASVGDDGPKVEAHVEMIEPGPMLAELSKKADLVVVGSRGFGPIRTALLGSVSNYVVQHAECPVVVIPQAED